MAKGIKKQDPEANIWAHKEWEWGWVGGEDSTLKNFNIYILHLI